MTSCISLTRLSDVQIDVTKTDRKITIKNLNLYSQVASRLCLGPKEYNFIKENIERFFVISDDEVVSYILYSRWDVNLFLYFLNYNLFVSTSTIFPLYSVIDATTKIVVTNKKNESRIYQSKFSDEALAGVLVLPFIFGRNIGEVREAKIQKSIRDASLSKAELEYYIPISDDFKLKICEDTEINEKN
jgi:hypothetical protein